MTSSIKKRVTRGIKFLNKIDPDWVEKINLETLSISSNSKCILGQLFGSFLEGRDQLNINNHFCQRLGFIVLDHRIEEYVFLNNEWHKQINKLKKRAARKNKLLKYWRK